MKFRKDVHLILWCAARKRQVSTACAKASNLAVALYKIIYSSSLKHDKRYVIFNAEYLETLKPVVDVEKQFYTKYRHYIAKENDLSITAIYIANQLEIEPPQFISQIPAPFLILSNWIHLRILVRLKLYKVNTSLYVYQTHINQLQIKQIKRYLSG